MYVIILEKDVYDFFPHRSRFRITYNLSKNGLKQYIEDNNHSKEPMLFGLGFHTNFNMPFNPEDDYTQYTLVMSIDRKCEMNNRPLATGNIIELSDEEKKLREEGILTQGHSISGYFNVKPDW